MCFKDWEFPHFMGDLDMNLPGMSTTHVKVRLPVCKRLFKEEYHIHITGNAAISLKNAHFTANSANHQKCKVAGAKKNLRVQTSCPRCGSSSHVRPFDGGSAVAAFS